MSHIDTSKVTRFEIIDHSIPLEQGGGRRVIVSPPKDWRNGKKKKVWAEFQDDGKTLKIFIS